MNASEKLVRVNLRRSAYGPRVKELVDVQRKEEKKGGRENRKRRTQSSRSSTPANWKSLRCFSIVDSSYVKSRRMNLE